MNSENTCPMSKQAVVDQYFLEHRAKLLDIAAFLDRLDRASGDAEFADFRTDALLEGLRLLAEGGPERARRLLELFSDPGEKLLDDAKGMKGAAGAPKERYHAIH